MSDSLIYFLGHRPLFNLVRWAAFFTTAGFGLGFGLSLSTFLMRVIF